MRLLSILLLSILSSNHCWSQANSSSDFSFDFQIKNAQEIGNVRVFFANKSGHTIETVQGVVDLSKKTVSLRGHSDYMLWVSYPDLFIRYDIYPNNMPFESHVFKISLPTARFNKLTNLVLDSSKEEETIEFAENDFENIRWQHQSCPLSDLGVLLEGFAPPLSARSYVDFVDANEPKTWQEIPQAPELPYFIVNSVNGNYTDQMKTFTEKYQIDFDLLDLRSKPEEYQQAYKHNRELIQQLTRQYGTIWKQDLPIMVVGLD